MYTCFLGVWHWKNPFIEPGRDNQVFPQGHRLIKLESLWDAHACVQLPDCMHVRASHGLMFPCCSLAVTEVLKPTVCVFCSFTCMCGALLATLCRACYTHVYRVFVLGSKVWNLKSPTQVCYDSLDLPPRSVRAEGLCPLCLCAWQADNVILSLTSYRHLGNLGYVAFSWQHQDTPLWGHPGSTATKTRGLHWRQDLY